MFNNFSLLTKHNIFSPVKCSQGAGVHTAEHFQRRHDNLRHDLPHARAVLPGQEHDKGGRGAIAAGGEAPPGPAPRPAASDRPGLWGVEGPQVGNQIISLVFLMDNQVSCIH